MFPDFKARHCAASRVRWEKIAGGIRPTRCQPRAGRRRTAPSRASEKLTTPMSKKRGARPMLELMLCSMLHEYYRTICTAAWWQGKRFWQRKITFFSVWFELRWGIVCCLMLTISLISLIFYFPNSRRPRPSATLFLQDGPDSARIFRAGWLRWRLGTFRARQSPRAT